MRKKIDTNELRDSIREDLGLPSKSNKLAIKSIVPVSFIISVLVSAVNPLAIVYPVKNPLSSA